MTYQPPPDQGPYGQPWPPPPYGQWGHPAAPPPRKRTGLIVGIVVAAAVLIGGGVTTAILLAGNGGEPGLAQPAPSSGAPAASSTQPGTASSGAPANGMAAKGGKPTPKEAAEAVAQGYSTANRQLLQDLLCVSLDQTFPDIQAGITMTVSGEPVVTGDEALVPVHATGPVRYNDFRLGLKLEAGVWCYATDEPPG